MTITMITGSSAAGEAIAPHFQFPTKAKPENAKLNIDILTKMKTVEGVFGKPKLTSFHTTFRMNDKGGMNEIEFEIYVEDNLIRLYPDAADLPGKRVMIEVDSGPGQMNYKLLAMMQARGSFYLYPCVPNTTAVTQETDQSYGLFKTTF